MRKWASAPTWNDDGKELIVAARPPTPGLFRVPVTGNGGVRLLGYTAELPRFPAISPDGTRLVYSNNSQLIVDIWRLNLERLDMEPLITSTRFDSNARYSPDGTKIVFQSARSGNREIWLSDSDGKNPRQLTNLKALYTSAPAWSPDGTRIAFRSDRDGNADIYEIDAQGGEPSRLTRSPAFDGYPIWSRDTSWIYFSSDRGGRSGIWKVLAGGGEPLMVVADALPFIYESADRRFLYVTKDCRPCSIWKMSVGGGDPVEVLRRSLSHEGHYAVVERGIYWIPPANPTWHLLAEVLQFLLWGNCGCRRPAKGCPLGSRRLTGWPIRSFHPEGTNECGPDAGGEFPVAARNLSSHQHLLHHLTPHIRQPEIPAHVAVGEASVVEAEAVEDGGLEIVDVDPSRWRC